MKASIETTLAAKAAGLYTSSSRSTPREPSSIAFDIVEQVATEGHMDSLTIADTMVSARPVRCNVVKKVIARLKKPVRFIVPRTSAWRGQHGGGARAGASVAHTRSRARRARGQVPSKMW